MYLFIITDVAIIAISFLKILLGKFDITLKPHHTLEAPAHGRFTKQILPVNAHLNDNFITFQDHKDHFFICNPIFIHTKF